MSRGALNILLVEDDDVDAMNVERAFKKASISHSVVRAADGLHASSSSGAGISRSNDGSSSSI